MNNQWIITIGREFCTGGAEAAKKLAETLNYDYLDKILIDETAEMLSISKEMVIKQDEKLEAYFDIPPCKSISISSSYPVHIALYYVTDFSFPYFCPYEGS